MQPYYSENGIVIYNADCREVLPTLESVDCVLTDLPYGTTACKWDSVIPLEPMWMELKRIVKPSSPVVLFGSQPFSSALVMSNIEWFKYEWIWRKSHATGQLNLNVRPMTEHESILVFGKGKITYNPQFTQKPEDKIRAATRMGMSDCYGAQREYERTIPLNMRVPTTVLQINGTNHGERGLHPTQKPLALLRYLVKTYSSEGETVLDFTMGSGTTLRAAKDLGLKAIGIEISEKYCEIAAKRLAQNVFDFEVSQA